MVVHWTDEADVKLFIAVLKIHSVKLNYEALAAAMGPGTSSSPSLPFSLPLFSIYPFSSLPFSSTPNPPANTTKPHLTRFPLKTDVTPKAITQRIAKLRAKAAASASAAVSGEENIAPQKAAAKAGGTTTKKRVREAKKVTGKKRKLGGDEDCLKREDDDEELGPGLGDGHGDRDVGLEGDGEEGGVGKVKGEEGDA